MLYNLMLFFHIFGTLLMFMGVAIALTALLSILYAKDTQSIRTWAKVAVKSDGLIPISVIFILFPGLYLVFSTWGWGTGWIDLCLATLIAMTIMGPVINLPRLKAILEAANNETNSSPSTALLQTIHNRTLWNSFMIMTMLGFGIVFLMTMKLAMVGSLVTLLISVVLGYVLATIILGKAFNSNKINTGSNHTLTK
ncbi:MULTISPECIES: hypothetical protein [Robertmurraya]|uniref:DUF2269 family protein n=1 Tax=Robertmurraya beringensis TaxID=641660 RepID=A0ABV6KTY7_9BACI